MWSLWSIEELINNTLKNLEKNDDKKEIDVVDSLNYFSANEYVSKIDFPPYPKSTMDGYALLSSDCSGASVNSPIFLEIVPSMVKAGEKLDIEISSGKCIKIETGGFLPKGADAVIPIEDVVVSEKYIEVTRSLGQYENVSLPGEELGIGDKIIGVGERIRPWHIATLVASGYEKIYVKKLRVGIVFTGDEFNNSNNIPFTNYLVKGWFEENGFKVDSLEYSIDDPKSIWEKVLGQLKKNTFSIVLGGTSKGDFDTVYEGLEGYASHIYRGVRMKPGKTTTVYIIDGKPVFSISGLPAAALSSLELIIKRILSKWLGLKYYPMIRVKAHLTRRITSKLGFVSFTRVRVYKDGDKYYAEPLVSGGSGSLRSIVLGNGYVVVPENVEGYDKNEVVEVVLYGYV